MNRFDADIVLPGSKSYSNRAILIASLAKGQSVLDNISDSDDTALLIGALSRLGVRFGWIGQNVLNVQGGTFTESPGENLNGEINVGPAGTAMRFLAALCAVISGIEVILKGNDRMHQRPIAPLVQGLWQLGAKLSYIGKENFPPLKIEGKQCMGSSIFLDGAISSQFFTAILMVAPLLKGHLEVNIQGKLVSRSYIDMTLQTMTDFGVLANFDGEKKIVVKAGQQYHPRGYSIEGDASGASYFWGMAAVSGGRAKVFGVNRDSLQGDVGFVKILERMGCEVLYGDDFIEVKGPENLKPVQVNMSLMPDTAQTLAVIAAFVNGRSKITGLSTLRIKETDRLEALKNELGKMGVETFVGPDFIEIFGGTPAAGIIETYGDHRMAMAFAVARVVLPEMEILNPEVVSKSFPNFWNLLKNH